MNIYSPLYNVPPSNTTSYPSTTLNHSFFATMCFLFRFFHSSSRTKPTKTSTSTSFHQSGPNASAKIDSFNDVGRDQNNINDNEVFQIFILYITLNTYNILQVTIILSTTWRGRTHMKMSLNVRQTLV